MKGLILESNVLIFQHDVLMQRRPPLPEDAMEAPQFVSIIFVAAFPDLPAGADGTS